jgi:hypothetical protein
MLDPSFFFLTTKQRWPTNLILSSMVATDLCLKCKHKQEKIKMHLLSRGLLLVTVSMLAACANLQTIDRHSHWSNGQNQHGMAIHLDAQQRLAGCGKRVVLEA